MGGTGWGARVGAPPAVVNGIDRCGTVVLLLGSAKAFHPSAVQQGGVGLHKGTLLLTATMWYAV